MPTGLPRTAHAAASTTNTDRLPVSTSNQNGHEVSVTRRIGQSASPARRQVQDPPPEGAKQGQRDEHVGEQWRVGKGSGVGRGV